MLSDEERRALHQIEVALREVPRERLQERLRRAARVIGPASTFVFVLVLAVAADITGRAVVILVGVAGIWLGWQACSARRTGAGPFVWRRLPRLLPHRRRRR